MTDILLIHPDYPWPLKYPPMGIAYLAAYLEKAGGYTVRVIDLAVEPMTPHELLKEVKAHSPSLVGVSFMTCQADAGYAISDFLKQHHPGLVTVAGGVHPSALPQEAISHFDYLVAGEGEWAIKALADALIRGQGDPHDIQGLLSCREKGNKVERAHSIVELDSLPFPAWHLLHMDRYKGLSKGLAGDEPFMVIVGSRGCPNHCIFCASKVVHGRRFRCRSPENILEEIETLYRHYGTRQFDFADDTMTVLPERIMNLCAMIRQRRLKIQWDCNARVNTVTPEMLRAMREAGCIRINFGVESGDEEILKRARKGVTLEQIRTAHRLAKASGLKVMSFFMIGLPGETPGSADKTLQFSRELGTDYPGLSIATPFPGTRLYDLARERQWIDDRPWSKYTTTIAGEEFTPVMRTEHMNREEILDKYREILKCFREMESRSGVTPP